MLDPALTKALDYERARIRVRPCRVKSIMAELSRNCLNSGTGRHCPPTGPGRVDLLTLHLRALRPQKVLFTSHLFSMVHYMIIS